MARLTRTQKYAELRDRISQDREESLKTNELSQYESKIKNIEKVLNYESDTDLNNRVVAPAEPTVQAEPAPVFETPINPTVNSEIKKAEEESMKSLEDILTDMMNSDFVPKKEEQVVTPVEVVKPVEPNPVITPVETVKPVEPAPVITPVETVKSVEPAPAVTPVLEVNPTPVVNNEPVDIMSTMEIISSEVDEISNIIGDQEKEVSTAEPVKPVENKPEPITPVEIKNDVVNNSFIDNTLTEVNKYNQDAGRTTLDNLSDSLVKEVIHSQEPVEEKKEDLDFSNTVSLEIEKVLGEINKQSEVFEPVVETPAVSEVEEAELEAEEVFNNTEIKNETFEHPVLTKTIEEPVVEIKNINDTLTNIATDANVLDDTIPFVVDREEDEEDEDDEEEAPSKALNVILGILIFVLVAVLGVIVYYILVARGIIG